MSRNRGKPGYLSSIDGWRAIAILGVLVVHERRMVALGRSQELGASGVFLFFCISGFLIAWRILEEEATTGKISLKSFYIRRIFRIQPAALVYLTVIALLQFCGVLHDRWSYWFGALLSYRNFQLHLIELRPERLAWFTNQFWTLGVEEHFYILISLFFVAVRRRRLAILSGSLLCLIAAQQIAEMLGVYSYDVSTHRTYWSLRFLIFPAILALSLRVPAVMQFAKEQFLPWRVFLSSVILLVVLHLAGHPRHDVYSPGGWLQDMGLLLRYVPAFWIVATVFHPQSLTTRLLEVAPLRFLGRISYSVYLWQELFFWANFTIDVKAKWLLALSSTPLHYGVVFIVAIASYYLIERPFIRMGHRLSTNLKPDSSEGF